MGYFFTFLLSDEVSAKFFSLELGESENNLEADGTMLI